MTPRRRIGRTAGLVVGLSLATAYITLVASAWAQAEAADTALPTPRAKAKAAVKGLKGKRKTAGTVPELTGLGAILFNPTEEEEKNVPAPPPALAEPGATATTEPGTVAVAPTTEPATPDADATTDAAVAGTTPAGAGETGATTLGTTAVGDTSTEPARPEGLGPTTPPKPPEPVVKLVAGDQDFPFLSTRSAELVATTEEVLAKVEPLVIPPIDPDLLQFGFSWSITGGTGTRPGREADVARCGIYGKPGQETKAEATVSTVDPACLDTYCRSTCADGTDPVCVSACVASPETLTLSGCPVSSTQSEPGAPSTTQDVCCTYDAERGSWDCGEPNAFPNRTKSFRNPSGVEMQILCLEPAPEVGCPAGEVLVNGVCQIERGAGADVVPLRAGSANAIGDISGGGAPLCCSVPVQSISDVLSKNASGYSPGYLFGSDCHPAAVALGTGVGGKGSAYSATTEIYGEGTLKWFAERKNDAYAVDLSGRLSLISELYSTSPDRYTLRARLKSLKGAYRRYLTQATAPIYVLGGLDLTDALVQVEHTAGQSTERSEFLPGHATVGVGFGRLYSVEPRIRLKKLEAMLLTHEVIAEPFSAEVARQIMLAWWALRSELGYDQRLLHTFRILKEAGLLTGPITAAVAYRFGQILNDPQFVSRRQGSDSLLSARVGTVYDDGDTGDMTLVIEIQDEHVFNLSTDNELYWAPRLGIAPRKGDWTDNRLFGANLPFSRLAGGLAVAQLPVGYRHFVYDGFLNKMGAMELSVRAGVGYGNDATVAGAPDGIAFSLGVGGKVSWYQTASQGWSLFVDSDAGMLDKKLVYAAVAGVRVEIGNMEAYYVAPGDLGDALPFDFPMPGLVTGAAATGGTP
jgi:hypothetical protein